MALRTLTRVGALLLATIASAHASNPPYELPTRVEGFQRIARDPAQRLGKAAKMPPTLGVLIRADQLIRICPSTSPGVPKSTASPIQGSAANATYDALIALNGLCKQRSVESGARAVNTAPTRYLQPGSQLRLIDPTADGLSVDGTLNPRTQGITAGVVAIRDGAYGRYLLLDAAGTAEPVKSPMHFALDQQGHFVGVSIAREGEAQSLRLLLPHEALSQDPRTVLQPGMAFPEVTQLVESLSLERSRDWKAMAQHAGRWSSTANANIDATLARAIAADKNGDGRDAIKAYEKVIEGAASHPQALSRLAPLYVESGQLEAAADAYLKVIQIVPDDALLRRELGMVLIQLAAYHEAIDHLQRATTLDKFDKLAWNALGVAHQALMHAHEAGDAFKRAIELDNAFYGAWLNLAALKHEHGDHTGAHAAYCEAAKRDPSSPTPWFGRGLLYAETGELAREIGAYQRALQIKPDDTKALYNLGKAYLLSGLVLDAIDTYETLRSLEPGHVDTLFNLGLAYFLNGENLKVEQVHMLIRALSRPDAEIFYLRFLAPIDRYLPDKADKARHLLED